MRNAGEEVGAYARMRPRCAVMKERAGGGEEEEVERVETRGEEIANVFNYRCYSGSLQMFRR
jgi:hypothetical protein